MPADLLLALVGYAIASSITPGPNNLLVLTSGLNHGVPRSLPLIVGISLGFAFMVIVVGIGLGSLIHSNPGFHAAAKALGVAYMLWLAWKVATSAPSLNAGDDTRAVRPLSAATGAVFQWVNPKAWAVALSATAAFSAPEAGLSGLAWVASVFVVIALASLSAWAAFGSFMRRLVDSPSHVRTFNIVMALFLVASALPVAYDRATSS
ncbi:LysE family translocator [Hyphomicrobium sp.]|uniref:LysE family translocator n=1 Tax=Hyphomicrobium sp. TaxID=82 RepID=UPI0025C7066C|nr:LysE family translocator [Hyphomicrobium sp.]MCC7252451.1 LysE family translocator [Hyphomicrobium sp.]